VSAHSGYCALPTKPSWTKKLKPTMMIAIQRAQPASARSPTPVGPTTIPHRSVIQPPGLQVEDDDLVRGQDVVLLQMTVIRP
jgi:hypothetical protein